MYKIAVIGDKKSIGLFSLSGFFSFEADDKESVFKILEELNQNDYEIIYITEKLFAMADNEIKKYSSKLTLIPGIEGNTGMGKQALDSAVKKVMGGIK